MEQSGVDLIALDIEAEFNLHVYGERLCLIQIFDGTRALIIDPIGVSAGALQRLFEHSTIGKLTYDASSDQSLLFKAFGFRIVPLVDLRPAVELLEYAKQDLGSVLEQALGVQVERKKRYQQYNWTRRPVEPGAIEYALRDVQHLYELQAVLMRALEERGLREEYARRNELIQTRLIEVDKQPRLFRSGEFRRLRPPERTRFEQAFHLRDACACALDVPPDWVMPKGELFRFAQGRITPAQIRNPSLPRRGREGQPYAEFARALAGL